MRIQKFMADCGLCSRRAAEELVKQGRVTVNGNVAEIGMNIDEEKDMVICDNKRLHLKVCDKQYFIFYKPRGVITSMKAQNDISIVADLIKGIKGRVYPVGRLDRDSEGLLLLTDNGELANRISHPSHHISKTYRVTVRGKVSDETLDRIRKGVEIEVNDTEKETTMPAGAYIQSEDTDRTVLHITLREGKNREIRRICEELGLEIMLLKRIAIGDLLLGHIQPGEYRPLTHSEIIALHEKAGMKAPQFKKKNEKTGEIKARIRAGIRQNKTSNELRFEKQLKKDIKKSLK